MNVSDDTRENQLLRALFAIQAIAEHMDDSPMAGKIYSIAHGVTGCCRACADSTLWAELVMDAERDGADSDLYLVDVMLGKAKR